MYNAPRECPLWERRYERWFRFYGQDFAGARQCSKGSHRLYWRPGLPIVVADIALRFAIAALCFAQAPLPGMPPLPDAAPSDVARMLKALLATHAVMLVCTIIPVAQLLLAPFGPFLGAYYGIRWVDTGQATPLAAAAKFGCAVGAVSALILTAIALILTLAIDLPPPVRHPDLDCRRRVHPLCGGNEPPGRYVPPGQNPKRRRKRVRRAGNDRRRVRRNCRLVRLKAPGRARHNAGPPLKRCQSRLCWGG